MSNLLGQLENDEAILLMYLAGELAEQDRAEVERMLQRDAGLRAQLAGLAATSDSVTAMLGQLDSPIAASRREAAVRSVSRALISARHERLAYASPGVRTARTSLNLKRFLVPAVAAAILVVGIFLWPRTIQMNPPEGSKYTIAEFPDVLAMDLKSEPHADPLTTLEQELLSLSTNPRDVDSDAWEPRDAVEER
jgi:anti-sigma-K factor RskA